MNFSALLLYVRFRVIFRNGQPRSSYVNRRTFHATPSLSWKHYTRCRDNLALQTTLCFLLFFIRQDKANSQKNTQISKKKAIRFKSTTLKYSYKTSFPAFHFCQKQVLNNIKGKNLPGGSAGRSYLFFTSAQNFSSNLFTSVGPCSLISKVMLFPLLQVFHTLNLNDELAFAGFDIFCIIAQLFYCIVSGESKPFLIYCSHFFSRERTFQNYVISFRDNIGLVNSLLPFNQL